MIEIAWAIAYVASVVLGAFTMLFLASSITSAKFIAIKLFLTILSLFMIVSGMASLEPIFNASNVISSSTGISLRASYQLAIYAVYLPLAIYVVWFIWEILKYMYNVAKSTRSPAR